MNVLLRGVGRILVLLTGHRQAGLLRNGNSTRCGACGCVKEDFHRTGRATGSIALGTQKEKPGFAGVGPNRPTLVASLSVARDPTTNDSATLVEKHGP